MPPHTYNDNLKVREALQLYFSQYHFKNGGYDLKWFKIKLGFIYIPLPNIKARVDAVKIHDIHHLITEYRADWRGEVEIAALEIATGCKKYSVAWLLNFGSFFIGLLIYPRYLLAAFLRGRKCATNLYFQANYDKVLEKTLGELRNTIEIDSIKSVSYKDYLAFISWCLILVGYHLALGAVFCYFLYELGKFLF